MEFPSADAISNNSAASYSYDAVEAQYHCSHCGSTLGNCSGNPAASKSAWCNKGTCTVCDDPDSCKCAPKDPTCGASGAMGIPPDAGADGEAEGGTDAASDVVVTDTGTGGNDTGAKEDGATEAGHDAESDGATTD
jgi:hypothetical protein